MRYASDYGDVGAIVSNLTIGGIYYIAVGAYDSATYNGTFTLTTKALSGTNPDLPWTPVSDINVVPHDYQSAAQEYSTNDIMSLSSYDCTCWNTSPDKVVWFAFSATTTQVEVNVDTTGDNTMSYPYIGLRSSGTTELDCERYTAQAEVLTLQYTGLTVGNWYYVQVSNYDSASWYGSFTITIADTY